MKKPKITVLMPVYNAEKFVGEAIDSVLNQTFSDFEFLIINDASTDRSEKVILSYQDPRIRYYKNKINMGVARTLNRGLKLAKGKYIARMDADDIFLPDKLELQHEILRKDKNLVIICSHFDFIDELGNFLSSFKLAPSSEEIYYELQFRNCIGHPTAIFNKRIILEEFNGYNEKYEVEDHDLWLRISKKYKIVKLDKVLLKVRLSKQSKTVFFGNAMHESGAIITKNNLQSLIGKCIDLDVIKALAKINPMSISPKKIKEALPVLEEVNIKILENCPSFLNKSIIKKSINHKKNVIRLYLLITILLNSLFGPVFKTLYKLYRLKKDSYH